MNSSVHENHGYQHCRVLADLRDRYAQLRRDIFEWAHRSKSRVKTLHAVVSRNNIGLMYEKLERVLGVSRRWVKELVGELRNLGVVKTPSNPAVVEIPDRKLYLLLVDLLETLLPSNHCDPFGRTRDTTRAGAPSGGGNPAPSGDSPRGESPLGGVGAPPPRR